MTRTEAISTRAISVAASLGQLTSHSLEIVVFLPLLRNILFSLESAANAEKYATKNSNFDVTFRLINPYTDVYIIIFKYLASGRYRVS